MGSGSWTVESYASYSNSVGRKITADGRIDTSYYRHVSDIYKTNRLNQALDPTKVIRECCDSEEHPNTIPVMLAIDVTGSMGSTAMEVASALNPIMTSLYEKVKDVQFCILGIGDLECDRAPIQISQFESDIRIAEQLDKLYFEGGGGGNRYESYTAAWYMGLKHTKLDCTKRNKKGIIITMGDEPCNPILHKDEIKAFIGDDIQADVLSKDLYEEASKIFDIYHIDVEHSSYSNYNLSSFKEYLPDDHCFSSTVNGLSNIIVNIILSNITKSNVTETPVSAETLSSGLQVNENGQVFW